MEKEIFITPFILEAYSLLPEEIHELKQGKSIFVMGEDPVTGQDLEANLVIDKTRSVVEFRNPQVTQDLKDEWYKRHDLNKKELQNKEPDFYKSNYKTNNTMKIEELLDQYQFESPAQFSSIAKTEGFKVEYNDGEFLFTSPEGEQTKLSFEEIEEKRTPTITLEESRLKSTELIAEFFDRDNIENLTTDFQLVKWKNFGEDNESAFTLIDQENKVAMNGGTLFKLAEENGFLLDGKGTKLQDGELSALFVTKKGTKIKIRRAGKKLKAIFWKEKLESPKTIIGLNITEIDQKRIEKGETVVMAGQRGMDLILKADKELNQVLLLTNKDVNLPDRVGGSNKLSYPGIELSIEDKNFLLNGKSTEAKLLASDTGFFMAKISMNQKNELEFSDIKKLTIDQAKEQMPKLDIIIADKIGGLEVSEDMKKDLLSGKSILMEGLSNAKGEKYDAYLSIDFEKSKTVLTKEDPNRVLVLDKTRINELKEFEGVKFLNDRVGELIGKYREDPAITEKQIAALLNNKNISGENISIGYLDKNDNTQQIIPLLLDTKYAKDNNLSANLENVTAENVKPFHLLVAKSDLGAIENGLEWRKEEIQKESITPGEKDILKTEISSLEKDKESRQTFIAIHSGGRDFGKELKDALDKDDFKKIHSLKQEGYQPSENEIKELGKNLSPDKKTALNTIFGIKEEVKKDTPAAKKQAEKGQENDKEKGKTFGTGKHRTAGMNAIGKAFSDM